MLCGVEASALFSRRQGGRRRATLLAAKKGGKRGAESRPEPLPVCDPKPAYQRTDAILQCLTLLGAYAKACGEPLLPGGGSVDSAPRALFEAPFAVISHSAAAEPLFTYGNAAALALFGYDWPTWTALPSSASAPAEARAERSAALAGAAAAAEECVRGYSGVRVTSRGRRFMIEDAVLWNLRGPTGGPGEAAEQGRLLGQSACFSHFTWLDPPTAEEDVGKAGERWRFTAGGGMELAAAEEAPVATTAREPPPPPPEQAAAALAALRARVEAQGASVRSLKAAGLAKGDEELDAAVAELMRLKAELAVAEAS